MAHWIIKGPKGEHLNRVQTAEDEEPWRDTPEGHSFIRVKEHSHDPTERYDEKSKRWKKCPILTAAHEKRERATAESIAASLPEAVIDLLVKRITAKLAQKDSA